MAGRSHQSKSKNDKHKVLNIEVDSNFKQSLDELHQYQTDLKKQVSLEQAYNSSSNNKKQNKGGTGTQSNFNQHYQQAKLSSKTGQKTPMNAQGSKLLKVGDCSTSSASQWQAESVSQAKKVESANQYLNEGQKRTGLNVSASCEKPHCEKVIQLDCGRSSVKASINKSGLIEL